MRKLDNIKYYDVEDIIAWMQGKIKKKEILDYFESGKLEGIKIENNWHTSRDNFKNFMEVLAKERVFFIKPHTINISEVKINGRILDIGGGGSGVITRFKESQVVAIDPFENEFGSVPNLGGLKIIMDATDLKFLENSFESVTAFFTLMYIPIENHLRVFEEIKRVLKKGGEFMLWDVNIPKRGNNQKDMIGVELKVILPKETIDAGYGVFWDKEQNNQHFLNLAQQIGFKIIENEQKDEIYYIRMQKT